MVSAHAQYMSLEETTAPKPQNVTEGKLQYNVNSIIFDLLPFDSLSKDGKPIDVPSDVYDFQFKVAQKKWGVEKTNPQMVAGPFDKVEARAFLGEKEGENINCVDSFGLP